MLKSNNKTSAGPGGEKRQKANSLYAPSEICEVNEHRILPPLFCLALCPDPGRRSRCLPWRCAAPASVRLGDAAHNHQDVPVRISIAGTWAQRVRRERHRIVISVVVGERGAPRGGMDAVRDNLHQFGK